jgi:hypothetical protein
MNEIEVEIHHRDIESTEGAQSTFNSLCASSVLCTVSVVNINLSLTLL